MLETLLFGQLEKVNSGDLLLVQGSSFTDHGKLELAPTFSGTIPPVINNVEQPTFYDGCMDFNNGRVAYDVPDFLNGNYFVETFVKFKPGFNKYFSHIIGSGSGIAANTWSLAVYNNLFTVSIAGEAGASAITAYENVWYYISFARKENVLYLFVEGQLQRTAPTTKNTVGQNSKIYIGDRMQGDPYLQYPLKGYVAGVRIQAGDINPPTQSYTPPTNPFPI